MSTLRSLSVRNGFEWFLFWMDTKSNGFCSNAALHLAAVYTLKVQLVRLWVFHFAQRWWRLGAFQVCFELQLLQVKAMRHQMYKPKRTIHPQLEWTRIRAQRLLPLPPLLQSTGKNSCSDKAELRFENIPRTSTIFTLWLYVCRSNPFKPFKTVKTPQLLCGCVWTPTCCLIPHL